MKTLSIVICIAILFFLHIKPYGATRVLHDQEERMKTQHLILQSLRSNTGGPPAPNPCIPGPSGRGCTATTISERNFAGHLVMAPPPPPLLIPMQISRK